MTKVQFGEMLVALRKQKGIKQSDFANSLNITASAVSKWEHGENLPDMAAMDEIAKVLGVSCDDLMNPERTLARLKGGMTGELPEEVTETTPEETILEETTETETIPPKKSKLVTISRRRLAALAVLLFLLGAACGIGIYTLATRKPKYELGARPVATRYIEDPNYGKMFEVAYVTGKEMSRENVRLLGESLREMYTPGKTVEEDTKGVRISIYDNDSDAYKWLPSEAGYVFFFLNTK